MYTSQVVLYHVLSVFDYNLITCSLYVRCVGTLTIVDNIVEALTGWIERHACSKIAVHLLCTFLVMLLAQAMGILQTTKVRDIPFLTILEK